MAKNKFNVLRRNSLVIIPYLVLGRYPSSESSFLYKHEVLSSVTRTHMKQNNENLQIQVKAFTCNSGTGYIETGRSLALLASQSSLINGSQATERRETMTHKIKVGPGFTSCVISQSDVVI